MVGPRWIVSEPSGGKLKSGGGGVWKGMLVVKIVVATLGLVFVAGGCGELPLIGDEQEVYGIGDAVYVPLDAQPESRFDVIVWKVLGERLRESASVFFDQNASECPVDVTSKTGLCFGFRVSFGNGLYEAEIKDVYGEIGRMRFEVKR